MEKIKHFFWFCSGASFSILKRCPTESPRFTSIGGTVFFTGILAAISGGFALLTIFDSYWVAFPFGLVWGLMIFNLDRFLVSSLKKKEKRQAEWLLASPRILLAVLIAIVVAKPLELRIFEPEISAELALIQDEQRSAESFNITERHEPAIKEIEANIARLEEEISLNTQKRDDLLQLASEEADGTGGSGKRNLGPIYQVKKANAEQADKELAILKAKNEGLITRLQARLDSGQRLRTNELAAVDVSHIAGLALQVEALERLADKYPSIAWANVFIMLLFIMIEASPVLVKLMSPKGPYDELLEGHEHSFVTHRRVKVHRLDTQLEKEFAWKG